MQQQQPQYVFPIAQQTQPPYMVAAQPGPAHIHPIVIQVPRQRIPPKIENYKSRSSKLLGIIQLVAGGFALVLNCIGIGIQVVQERDNDAYYWSYSGNYYYRPATVYYGGVGIWCYIFFALSGSFAISAAARKTKCTIVAHMVLAIIASVFAFLMLGMSFWAFGHDVNRLQEGHDSSRGYYKYNYQHTTKGIVAVSTFWVLASLLEIVACIWSSTLCCGVMCCVQIISTAQGNVQHTANTGPSGVQVLVLDSQGRPLPGAQVIRVPPAGSQGAQGYGVQPAALANQPYIYPVQQGGATAAPQGTTMGPLPYKS